MTDEQITEGLLAEYSEMRSEMRDLMTVLSGNVKVGLALVVGVVSLSSSFSGPHTSSLLYLIPTTMFVMGMIWVSQAASLGVQATYCAQLSRKIKKHLGADKVLFEWEYGPLWRQTAHPLSIVSLGYYIACAPFVLAFVAISWLAFKWWWFTVLVHAGEMIVFAVFAGLAMRWTTMRQREARLIELSEAADE